MGHGLIAQGIPTRRTLAGCATTAAIAVAALVAVATCGCGSAIQTQATAIRATAEVLDVASDLAEQQLNREMDACTDVACTHDVELRWAPAGAAQAATLAALQAWVSALELARVAESGGVLWRAVLRAVDEVLAAWRTLDAALAGVGVDLPDPPTLTLSAREGGS